MYIVRRPLKRGKNPTFFGPFSLDGIYYSIEMREGTDPENRQRRQKMKKEIEKQTGLKVLKIGRYKGQRKIELSFSQFMCMTAEQSEKIAEICGRDSWITSGGAA